MFASRFDPSQLTAPVASAPEGIAGTTPPAIVPLKRQATESDNEEYGSHQDSDESSNSSSEEDEDRMQVDYGASEEDSSEVEEEESKPSTHSTVLSRFKQTVSLQERLGASDIAESKEDESIEDEAASTHQLKQIPQPEFVKNPMNLNRNSLQFKSTGWLNTEKIYYDNSLIKPFSDYANELEAKLLQNICKNFSTNTFPIQSIILDSILPVLNFTLNVSKRNFTRRIGDILVNAATGSGKTLAYSIPIVQTLFKRQINRLRCIIIVPTKLLINQVYTTLTKLTQGTSLIVSIAKLENSLKDEHKKLSNLEPDILITTPGRLVDHLNMKSINLKNLKFLIIDEADRLLNQSFQGWCPKLMSHLKTDKLDTLPGNVIKMIFSATLTTNTEKLNGLNLYKPKLFLKQTDKLYQLPNKLNEFNINIPTAKSVYKPLILLYSICQFMAHSPIAAKILIFVKSNESSIRLSKLLQLICESRSQSSVLKNLQNLAVSINSVNSNNSKAENKKIVANFSHPSESAGITILITTDIMSRGIDINDITQVINYDPPMSSQQYVHRVGRTARANELGSAYNLLVGRGERTFFDDLNKDLDRDGKSVQPLELDFTLLESDSELYTSSLESLKNYHNNTAQA
ncbi:CCT_1a_G0047840.mRNA.1.CDS.1 [Saccharomyces cerevisiae]|nr:CCT_1a_G0047840.mRNA.1.CDS.1 [Saccharomyces cerevisiae]CAI7452518.1 CCT_1a_G0047840.mRNA.1.CDS.1 [Saccharomyces cerevisiae]